MNTQVLVRVPYLNVCSLDVHQQGRGDFVLTKVYYQLFGFSDINLEAALLAPGHKVLIQFSVLFFVSVVDEDGTLWSPCAADHRVSLLSSQTVACWSGNQGAMLTVGGALLRGPACPSGVLAEWC